MARVYRARDTTLGTDCAIKILHVPPGLRDALRARLRAEAHAMAVVRHPHVLRVIDVGTEGDADWIAMDLAPGGSLDERFERTGPLPAREAARHHADVLSALEAAHRAGIVHRDVKPSNLLTTADGRVLLADFGIARVSDETALRATRTGMTMGTMAYMAPEQRIDARSVSPAADQYAVAASLYWLISGWTPMDLFTADAASQRWNPIPAPLRPVLLRATRHDPAQRYASAAAMEAALREVLPSLPDTVAGTPAAVGPRTPTLPASSAPPVPLLLPTSPDAPTIAPETLVPPAPAPAHRAWLALGPALLLLSAVGVWIATRPSPEPPRPPAAPAPSPAAPAPSPAAPVAPVPVAPASPAPVAAPAPSAVPAPSPIVRPAAPPSPSPASPPAPPAGPVPLGRWTGSFQGRPCVTDLRGTPGALSGTVTVRFGDNHVPSEVTGAYDAATRTLTLADALDAEDAGTYRATLSADGRRFEGQFRARRGTVVPFVWSAP